MMQCGYAILRFTVLLLILFIIMPYYFKLPIFNIGFASFWNWYYRIFLLKAISVHFVLLLFAYLLQSNYRSISYVEALFTIGVIIILVGILIYINVTVILFLYFNHVAYNQSLGCTSSSAVIKLMLEDNIKDHFSYNKTLIFWYKYNVWSAIACATIQLFFIFSYLSLIINWCIVFKKLYTAKPDTYLSIIYYAETTLIYFYYTASIYIFSVFSLIIVIILN